MGHREQLDLFGEKVVQPAEVELETTGVLANRRFHIVDADRRRYNQLRNGALVQVRPDYDPEREQEVLKRIKDANSGPLDSHGLQRLFERIIDECRQIERLGRKKEST